MIMLETAGMMNTNSTSENHQAALEQPAGTSAPSNDPKKLAKQRLDKKYREKKKQEMTELKRKVDMLMERNKHLERKCTLNSKEDKNIDNARGTLTFTSWNEDNEGKKRKKNGKKISKRIKRIKADMVEISEGQKRIREGQREVREKFQEISEEAAKLKEETNLICQQSAANELKLHLMFQIIRARAENDGVKDALLTRSLRSVILQISMSGSNGKAEPYQKLASLQIDRRPPKNYLKSSCVPITSRLLKPAPASSSSTACSFFEMMMRRMFYNYMEWHYQHLITTTILRCKDQEAHKIYEFCVTSSNLKPFIVLSLKEAKEKLQGEEGAIEGTSPDQKVQRRKNIKSGKREKKRKSKGMVLRATGEENEHFLSEIDSIKLGLQLMQDDMEMQNTEFCISQSKTITVQEICVETLYQKLQLMAGSVHLDVAPSKANQSLDDISELKHRSMLNTKNIDLLFETFFK
ncbi:hypothetical protein DKX38_000542 [Salix brachista]|uniref:BZIP domain-containing protein n=1 Tax=Salix brachista TaxID=2182728 RepID=A0A5N5P2L3_9ROSI|nr:hypothetical protein DKX38_000542 [Salix brachista]